MTMQRTVRLGIAFLLAAAAVTAGAQSAWVGTWAAAPSAKTAKGEAMQEAETLRQIVHVSLGGSTVRVTLTNELGTEPLVIDGVHVAQHATGGAVQPGSDTALLFGGQPAITIPAGAVAVSDPVSLKVAPLSDLAITVALPAQTVHTMTAHDLGLETNYLLPGDALSSPEFPEAKTFDQWRFLKCVEVERPKGAAVVTLGDSITDGYRSTANTNQRWPDVLAARLQSSARLKGIGVLNEGISGNRILHNGAGPNALARFDRDVLSQSGVRYLIVMEGINDIGGTAKPRAPDDKITAQQLIVAYEQMIERAHAHGIKVFGATLTPFIGAGYASPQGETMREAVNTWIRTNGHFDGVIDFDEATRDATDSKVLSPAADSGDHLHPGDAGYKTMGDAIDLKLFR